MNKCSKQLTGIFIYCIIHIIEIYNALMDHRKVNVKLCVLVLRSGNNIIEVKCEMVYTIISS